MCEQSIVEYCANRKQQLTQNTNVPFLSPINLLSVTLWYLKHYHSERYIAAELHFSQTTVNYFLSAMIDILYRCVYQKLVVLPDDMDDEDTTHGPEQYHKLIVDSTCIPIDQPEDREERKTYYHGKSPTNYGFKVQIACDFRHQIVHVSECFKGSVHDLTILRESGLLEYVEDNVQIIADKGYIGEPYVVTPRKKPRGGELTTEDKDFNRNICSARAAIENINQRMKQYAIIGHVYRGSYGDFDKITKITRVVSALCNLNLDKHPIRKD
ncbi:unnamed protein product [Rotaria sp. Silwood2]|nr:unnamed protein product [Rotaria sp. Silwood2]